MAIMSDLTFRIRSSTSELTKGLDKAKQNISKFSKQSVRNNRQVKKSLGEIKGGVMSMGSVITSQLGASTGMFGELAMSVSGMIGPIRGATMGMKGFKVALISTGIGAVVVALASFVTYLSQTQTGLDLVNKITTQLGAVFKVLIDRLGILGSALVKLFKRDFAGAAKDAKRAVSGIGDAMVKNFKEGGRLAEEKAKLDKEEVAFLEEKAAMEAQIKQLRLESRDQSLSESEQIAKINQAISIQNQLSDKQVSFAKQKLELKQREDALGENTLADDRETAVLAARINEIEGERSEKLQTLVERQNTLTAKQEKAAAAAQDQLEAERSLAELKQAAEDTQTTATIGFKTMGEESLSKAPKTLAKVATPVVEGYAEALAKAEAQEQSFGAQMAQTALQIGQSAKNIKEAAKGIIKAFINQGIAAIIGNTLKGSTGLLGPLALPIAAAAGAGASALFSKMIPGFANGGIHKGGLAVVGERGPELVATGGMARVHNAGKTANMIAGGGINVNIRGVLEGNDVLRLVAETAKSQNQNFGTGYGIAI